jgi:RNA polymerase sigma-70 factor, ECF subfamily
LLLNQELFVRYAQLSSIDLIRTCIGSSDERAWTEFIRRFQVVIASAVLRTARLWGDPSRAQLDDLIQETYLKLCDDNYRLLRAFRPRQEDSIYGYLKVVAANVVHDRFKAERAQKRGASQTDSGSELLDVRSGAEVDDSFEIVSRRLQLEQIERVLRRVNDGKDHERNRTIFWLRHRQGLTASEIASIPAIGLTTEGVETVLLRLTSMIRSHINGSPPHREVKVLNRQNRFRKLGT